MSDVNALVVAQGTNYWLAKKLLTAEQQKKPYNQRKPLTIIKFPPSERILTRIHEPSALFKCLENSGEAYKDVAAENAVEGKKNQYR